MKKFIIAIAMLFGFISSASAISGVNIGISLTAGQFEADGAAEKFTGAHGGSAVPSPGNVTKKASDEGDSAEALFYFPSIFIEKTLGDRLAIGVDYVPTTLESETAENIQNRAGGASIVDSQTTNTVQVDFEDLTTVYAKINLNNGLYFKAGVVSVDVVTKENLGTGGAYGNTDLDGKCCIGYNRDQAQVHFQVEAHTMDLDGVTLTNTADSTKSVTADGVSGYGAKLN